MPSGGSPTPPPPPSWPACSPTPDNYVRYIAAEAMRYLPTSARQSVLTQCSTPPPETAKPWLPIDEEDPLHFAHGRLAMLLFYSGNAYGPKGIIWNNLSRRGPQPALSGDPRGGRIPLGFTRSTLQVDLPLAHRGGHARRRRRRRRFGPRGRSLRQDVRIDGATEGVDLMEKYQRRGRRALRLEIHGGSQCRTTAPQCSAPSNATPPPTRPSLRNRV